MYRGFLLNESRIIDVIRDNTPFYYNTGSKQYQENDEYVQYILAQNIIGDDGILDGTAIQNDWFPSINCDIFISHSHRDENLAIALAGWLRKKFGLKSFIDSCFWQHADVLQKKLDDMYCYNNNGTYDYYRRNISTSHVHLMLNMALMKMIDKTECLFFLNTPNSIYLNEIDEYTLSPWIFSEIGISKMIEKRLPQRRSSRITDNKMAHKVDTSHLMKIDTRILKNWEKSGCQGVRALDKLYNICDNL